MRSDSKITITIMLKTTRGVCSECHTCHVLGLLKQSEEKQKGNAVSFVFEHPHKLITPSPLYKTWKEPVKKRQENLLPGCFSVEEQESAAAWREAWVVQTCISMVLASVPELLCPSRDPGCLRLCPFGFREYLAPGGCLFWCVHFKTRR